MKLKSGTQYKVKWIDAFGDARWTDTDQLDKLLEMFTTPAEQTLYFIKQTKDFYIFTSGKIKESDGDQTYVDIHGIPKGWIVEIKAVR